MQKQLLVLIISTFCLFISVNAQAKVQQSIDRQEISAGETFVLDIQIDKDVDVQPDLSLIPADFTIVSSSQYQHTQIINGVHSSIKGWKIKLKTLKTGKVTIPSITVGNESTQPIVLNIKDASDQLDLNGQDKAIYLEAKVDAKSAYVQQQIVYTISLYRAVQTHYARLTEPNANNSIVEKLGDDIQFEKNIGSKRYIVTQRKYAIFPQQSGPLTISPVTFTADVNDSNRRRSLFLNSTRPISISTKPISIDVKPKPAGASTPWLPAKNVILADRWTPTAQDLKVGEPVTWTIMLSVQGLSESQLPEIDLPTIPGLELYPDTPQKERKVEEKGITGQRIEKYAVMPSKEGELVIPEITLAWWNTETDSLETAILPSRTLNVLPGKISQSTPQVPPQNVEVTRTASNVDEGAVKMWQIIAGVFGLLWIVTLVLYFSKPTRKVVYGTDSNDLNDTSYQSGSTYQQLKQGIKTQNISEIESNLLKLVNDNGFNRFRNLSSLRRAVKCKSVGMKLKAMEASRYSRSQKIEPTQYVDADDVKTILNELKEAEEPKPQPAIPGLYARNIGSLNSSVGNNYPSHTQQYSNYGASPSVLKMVSIILGVWSSLLLLLLIVTVSTNPQAEQNFGLAMGVSLFATFIISGIVALFTTLYRLIDRGNWGWLKTTLLVSILFILTSVGFSTLGHKYSGYVESNKQGTAPPASS